MVRTLVVVVVVGTRNRTRISEESGCVSECVIAGPGFNPRRKLAMVAGWRRRGDFHWVCCQLRSFFSFASLFLFYSGPVFLSFVSFGSWNKRISIGIAS